MSVYSGSNATMIWKVSQAPTVLLKTKRTDALSVIVSETQIDIAKNKIEQEALGIITERCTLALSTTCLNLSQWVVWSKSKRCCAKFHHHTARRLIA